MSPTWPPRPPRATQRRSPSQIATTTPRMMHSAYARIGNGPEVPDALVGARDARAGHRRHEKLLRGCRREDGAEVLRDRSGPVPSVHTTGAVPSGSSPDDLRAVADLVAAGRQLLALLDRHPQACRPRRSRQRAGEPAEARVEPVEVAAQRGRSSRAGSVVTNCIPTRRAARIEPGQRRGDVGHHHLADVGAVRVAEEDQGRRQRRSVARSIRAPSVAVSATRGPRTAPGAPRRAGRRRRRR